MPDTTEQQLRRIADTLDRALERLDSIGRFVAKLQTEVVALQTEMREVQNSSGGVYPTRNPEVVAQEIATGMRG